MNTTVNFKVHNLCEHKQCTIHTQRQTHTCALLSCPSSSSSLWRVVLLWHRTNTTHSTTTSTTMRSRCCSTTVCARLSRSSTSFPRMAVTLASCSSRVSISRWWCWSRSKAWREVALRAAMVRLNWRCISSIWLLYQRLSSSKYWLLMDMLYSSAWKGEGQNEGGVSKNMTVTKGGKHASKNAMFTRIRCMYIHT